MIVQNITELTVTGIYDRGVPNRECIGLQVNVEVDLGRFGLMLGRYTDPHSALPYFDNLFWFGDGVVKRGDWLFVYTGSGKPRNSKASNGVNDIFCLFWGRPTTLFAETSIAPILFRVDAVSVLALPTNQPQLFQPQNQ